MTDEQIVKALEQCGIYEFDDKQESCKECPFCGCDYCKYELCDFALDLIKRQQAEFERLHEVINAFEEQSHKELMDYMQLSEKYENARAEAVREFAEKLKDVFVTIDGTFECWEVEEHIDNLVKEMTEKEGGKG